MTALRTVLPCFALTLLLSACTTPTSPAPQAAPAAPAAPTAPAAPAPRKESAKNLRKGMTDADIRALWGEPKAVHTGKAAGETILVYQFDVATTQKMVAADVAEVPAVDPITGQTRTVLDPILKPQQVTVIQTIVLQLIDGRLVSWARQLGEQRSFN